MCGAQRVANPALRTIVMGCAAGVPSRDELHRPLATLPSVKRWSRAPISTLSECARRFDPRASRRRRLCRPARERCSGFRMDATSTAPSARRRCRAGRTGRGRSMTLVEEARALAEIHPEIVITGIHIGTYGRDIGSSLGAARRALIDESAVACDFD